MQKTFFANQAVYRDYWDVPGKRWINVDQVTRNEISDKFYNMIRRGKPSDPDQLDRLIRDAGQQSWRNRDKGIRRRAQKRKTGGGGGGGVDGGPSSKGMFLPFPLPSTSGPHSTPETLHNERAGSRRDLDTDP